MPRRYVLWLVLPLVVLVSTVPVHRPEPAAVVTTQTLPPSPFPAARFNAVYVPAHYQPYPLYAEEVGVEPGCWSWLGETSTGRPAWFTGLTTPTGVKLMAAYEVRPHHWRVWFAAVGPSEADELIARYRQFLADR